MKNKNAVYVKLHELLRIEHDCDQNNCLIQAGMAEQYEHHIFDLFSSSGAASDEFCKLAKLVVTDRKSSIEANKICKTIEHQECNGCGAHVWNMYDEYERGENVGCSNCGTVFIWDGKVRK